MAKKKKFTKSSYTKQHEKFVREQNQSCFLDNKQKIKYHAFILLEVIPLERKDQLIRGLYRLYADAPPHIRSQLNDCEDVLSKTHSKLFQWNSISLPYIITDRLKGEILSFDCVFRDIGNNIRTYQININEVTPSTLVLQVQVYLELKLSKKINQVIYKYHKEVNEPVETSKRKDRKIYPPTIQKESEIYAFREELHKEAVNFLRQYFKGDFFELSYSDVSVVPTIDLFSLDYPANETELSKWIGKRHGFLSCLSTVPVEYYIFKYENYLLFSKSKKDTNYLILANEKTTENRMYPNIYVSIKEIIRYCSFDLLAIDRWVTIQQEVVASLNTTVSEEILNIQDNRFEKAIEKRKTILKKTFSFDRFVSEVKGCRTAQDRFPFKNIKDERHPGRDVDFFKELNKGIVQRVKVIEELIDRFNKQHEKVLNLKNVEFSKKNQKTVVLLTIVIIFLTLIQIYTGMFEELTTVPNIVLISVIIFQIVGLFYISDITELFKHMIKRIKQELK